jgi:hypothetical protein
LVLNFSWIIFILISLGGGALRADIDQRYKGEPQWDSFSRFIEDENRKEQKQGTAYILSGALAVIGSAIGFERTQDPFARTVFTVSQSMGIAAIGYGTYLSQVGSEYDAFHRSLERSTSLSLEQKNQVLSNYLAEKSEMRRKARLIRAFTHGFIAALNFYNGSKQTDTNLQNVHYFIGGINLVACVSFSF